MKIPKTFQLAGTKWQVQLVDGLSDLGLCDADSAVIRIKSGLSPQIEQSTFCHELVHAVLYTTGLREHSEREVDAFGQLLHQYLTTAK